MRIFRTAAACLIAAMLAKGALAHSEANWQRAQECAVILSQHPNTTLFPILLEIVGPDLEQ